MSKIQKGLVVLAIITILLCALGAVFVAVFGARIQDQSAGSAEVKARARAFAASHTQQQCLEHGVRTARTLPGDFSGTLDNQMFLSTCIKFATTTPGFCDESPTTKSITQALKQRERFQKKVCSVFKEEDKPACRSLVPMITPYCYQETVLKKQPK